MHIANSIISTTYTYAHTYSQTINRNEIKFSRLRALCVFPYELEN